MTGTGGDVEYVKTLTNSVALLKRKVDLAVVTDSQDTTSERDGRARDVAEVRGTVDQMQDWVTEVESIATQPLEIVDVIQLVPQERIQERIVEETFDVPVPHLMEEIVAGMKHVPQERVQNGTVDQIVAVAVPRTREETGRVIQLTPQDRISGRIGEQTFDVPIPQIRKEIGERIQLILQGWISDCLTEQIVDAPVRQIREQIVEVLRVMPQERVQQRTQAKDPAVQVAQKSVDVANVVPHERVLSHTRQQIVDMPVVVQHQAPMIQDVLIQVFEDERAGTKDKNFISEFHFDEIPLAPQIEAIFDINVNGILRTGPLADPFRLPSRTDVCRRLKIIAWFRRQRGAETRTRRTMRRSRLRMLWRIAALL